MSPTTEPRFVGMLARESPEARDSVLDALPAVLVELTDDVTGIVASTSLARTIGLRVDEPVDVAEVVDPAHLATALALLAQEVPTPVPTASWLRLTTSDEPIDVLATSRRAPADGQGGRPLLALVPAPATTEDEDELRHRQEVLAEAERVAKLGSWEWDIVADEVTWSDELFRIYGHEPRSFEASLSTVIDHTEPEDRDYVRAVIEHGLASQLPFTYAHRMRRPGGELRTLQTRGRVTEVDAAGHPLHMVGVCQDVSSQLELQELGRQYRRLYERERQVASRLRQVDELKDALVAAVSHDLRTPLTVIVGSATTLRDHVDELDDDTRTVLVENVLGNATRLHAMLSDLLDLDRLRRGALDPNLRDTDLRELVRGVLLEGGYGDVLLEPTGPRVVAQLDAPKVERIVENLVRNARRFAPAGTQVRVRVDCDDTDAVLTVEDDGPGVPPEERARIFEPFERGATDGAPSPGSGLGLAIVHQFARLHGGRAWVDERPGGGAAFHVRLPLNRRG